MLAAVRKTAFYHHRIKQGEYQLAAGPPLRRLSGLVLGLVGLGRIARAVVPRARSLGLQVVATTPSGDDHGTDCRMLPFEELLRTSDIVSLHIPLTEETRASIDPFAMKQGAILVNTARGELVDEERLVAALTAGLPTGTMRAFWPLPTTRTVRAVRSRSPTSRLAASLTRRPEL